MSELETATASEVYSLQLVEEAPPQDSSERPSEPAVELLPSFTFYDHDSRLAKYMLTLERERLVATILNSSEQKLFSYGCCFAVSRLEPSTSRAKVKKLESLLKPLDNAFRINVHAEWNSLRFAVKKQLLEFEPESPDTVASIEYCLSSIMEYCKAAGLMCGCDIDESEEAQSLISLLQNRHVQLLQKYPIESALLGELLAYWHTEFESRWQEDALVLYKPMLDATAIDTYWTIVRNHYINHSLTNDCEDGVCEESLLLITAGQFSGNKVTISDTCFGKLSYASDYAEALDELVDRNLPEHAEELAKQGISRCAPDDRDMFIMFFVERKELAEDLEGAAEMMLHAFAENPSYYWYLELRDFCCDCHPTKLSWQSWSEKLISCLEEALHKQTDATSREFESLNSIKVKMLADENRYMEACSEAKKGCSLYALRELTKQKTDVQFEQILEVVVNKAEALLAIRTDLAEVQDVLQIAWDATDSKEQRHELRQRLKELRERHHLKGQKAAAFFRRFGL